MTLRFRKEVAADIATAASWYEKRAAGLGRRFRQAVYRRAREVAAHPLLYATAFRDFRRALLPTFPYVLYYRIETDVVVVFAIFHAMRDPQALPGILDERDDPEQPTAPP